MASLCSRGKLRPRREGGPGAEGGSPTGLGYGSEPLPCLHFFVQNPGVKNGQTLGLSPASQLRIRLLKRTLVATFSRSSSLPAFVLPKGFPRPPVDGVLRGLGLQMKCWCSYPGRKDVRGGQFCLDTAQPARGEVPWSPRSICVQPREGCWRRVSIQLSKWNRCLRAGKHRIRIRFLSRSWWLHSGF